MQNELSKIIFIRDGKLEDHNLVIATFLRGLYYGDSWFGMIPKQVFMDNYKHVISKLLEKNVLKVACLIEDPDTIVGYSLLNPSLQTIHWVFVKKLWRNKGIGRALTPMNVNTVTHLNQTGKTLLPKLKDATFNPFAL